MLVGMLKNSSLYNPIRRPELVISRRNIVFQQMLRNEMLTQKEVDSLQQLPLQIQFNPQSHREGLRPIFGLPPSIYAKLDSGQSQTRWGKIQFVFGWVDNLHHT